MAKKSKHRRVRAKHLPGHAAEPNSDTHTAEVATVAWMLALLATLIAEVSGILIRMASLHFGFSNRLHVLSSTLLVTALLAGILTLVLTPVTLKLRRVPPPRPIVVGALIVGFIPVLTVVLLALR